MTYNASSPGVESVAELRTRARRAGFLYLLLALVAPIADLYLPRTFLVAGNAAATARNIAEGVFTYRVWIVSETATNVIMLLVALALYHLLERVDRAYARLMLTLVVVGVSVSIVNLLLPGLALAFVGDGEPLAVFTDRQREALAYTFFRARTLGGQIATVFWGLWLFPLGALVLRSGFIPRWLGWLLLVGGVSYLGLSIIAITLPSYTRVALPVLMPFFLVGELSTIVWLLVKGVRDSADIPLSRGIGKTVGVP